jgi:DNA polymerase-1
MTLMLVDGSNILLRCAFGGEIPPEQSTPNALVMIERAAAEAKATHCIIALDHPDEPTWRKLEYSDYKANRTTSSAPWIVAGAGSFGRNGYRVEMVAGFEADDIIATIALRSIGRTKVVVVSNDSDLLPLTAAGVDVLRPLTGGDWQPMIAADVCEKYRIPTAAALIDYKAMVGEVGDNIKGVPGIGAKKASALLAKFPTLEDVIHAGAGGYNKEAGIVAKHADVARLALRLLSLRPDVPIAPIVPSSCVLRRSAA